MEISIYFVDHVNILVRFKLHTREWANLRYTVYVDWHKHSLPWRNILTTLAKVVCAH